MELSKQNYFDKLKDYKIIQEHAMSKRWFRFKPSNFTSSCSMISLSFTYFRENGEVLCRNVTRTYYSVDSGVAEFIGQGRYTAWHA